MGMQQSTYPQFLQDKRPDIDLFEEVARLSMRGMDTVFSAFSESTLRFKCVVPLYVYLLALDSYLAQLEGLSYAVPDDLEAIIRIGRKPGFHRGQEVVALCGYARKREEKLGLFSSPPKQKTSWVYFLASDNGLIKIGCSSDPKSRLSNLMSSSPIPLSFLGMMQGSRNLEAKIHHRFSYCRRHGEWFEATEDLLSYIKEHCERTALE